MYFYEKIIKAVDRFNKDGMIKIPGKFLSAGVAQSEVESTHKQRLASIKDAMLVDVSNVRDYFKNYTDYNELHDHIMKSHIVNPPYENMYVEIGRDLFQLYADVNRPDMESVVNALDICDMNAGVQFIYKKIDYDAMNDATAATIRKYNFKWVLNIRLFFNLDYKHKPLSTDMLVTTFVTYITDSGKIFSLGKKFYDKNKDDVEIDREVMNDTLVPFTDNVVTPLTYDLLKTDIDLFIFMSSFLIDITEKQFDDACTEMIVFIGLMAITFMHCKNVKVVEIDTLDSLSNTKRKQILRKGLEGSYYKYKKILIEPFKEKSNIKSGSTNDDPSSKSFHICRGHFKDFSKGKGLFGKYKGLYWWDNFTRGDVDVGVVEKEYAIRE